MDIKPEREALLLLRELLKDESISGIALRVAGLSIINVALKGKTGVASIEWGLEQARKLGLIT